MKPKNFMFVLLVLICAGGLLWRLTNPPEKSLPIPAPASPSAYNSDSAPLPAFSLQSPPSRVQSLIIQDPSAPVSPPASAPDPPDPPDQPAPPVATDLKDDPQIAALLAKIRDQREIRRQALEQSLSQLNDQPGSPVQIDLQNRLAELQQPVPPPTDFGQVELAPGVSVRLPLASGELATLTPAMEANGLLHLDIEVAPAHPNRFSSPEKGGFADATPGQVKVFAVGDHVVRIVPLLKSAATP